MLKALGYEDADVKPKCPVEFKIRTGRKGRKPETDFFVFSGQPHTRATSLITIEAKHPREAISAGKEQAESYAQNMRTPFIFYTNGSSAELWQLQSTTECNLLLSICDGEFSRKRGELEGFLLREAAIAHSKNLACKDFNLTTRDHSAYELSEYDRLKGNEKHIFRDISKLSESSEKLSIDEFVCVTTSSVIVAKSGFGKSVFSRQICRTLLQKRFEKQDAPLPIHIFLPDVAASEISLTEYLVQRLSAYLPSITHSNLSDLINTEGFLVVADGYNRLSSAEKKIIISKLRDLNRDITRFQYCLLTNTANIPTNLECHYFQLNEFERDELDQLSHSYGLPHLWLQAPKAIVEIASIPVLATQVIEFFDQEHYFPNQIEQVFDHWLQEGLSDLSDVEKSLTQEFLSKIAERTIEQTIKASELVTLASEVRIDQTLLDKISDTGLLSISGESVELSHETLASFLRARKILEGTTDSIIDYFSEFSSGENHLFDAVAMSLSKSEELQDVVWSQILKNSLGKAIASLRFRADLSSCYEEKLLAEKSRSFMSAIIGAVSEPINLFFEEHDKNLFRELAGQEVDNIGVTGNLGNECKWLNYGFRNITGISEVVEIANPTGPVSRGKDINHYGLRLDSGKIIGLENLRDAIFKQIENKSFLRGPAFTEEWCLGRLKLLSEHHNFLEFQNPIEISTILTALRPHAGKFASDWYYGYNIGISSLISDLEQLQSENITELNNWWIEAEDVDLQSEQGRECYADCINKYFHRAHEIYFATLDSIPNLKTELIGYFNRPHRHIVHVSDGRHNLPLWHDWIMPVENILDSGADVFFKGFQGYIGPLSDHDAAEKEYNNQLKIFGRFSSNTRFSAGWRKHPTNFNLKGVSPVIELASSWVKRDITDLFDELPVTDSTMLY